MKKEMKELKRKEAGAYLSRSRMKTVRVDVKKEKSLEPIGWALVTIGLLLTIAIALNY